MPTFYIQRTMVQIASVEAEDANEALENAKDCNWETSIDTEVEYYVLSNVGEQP